MQKFDEKHIIASVKKLQMFYKQVLVYAALYFVCSLFNIIIPIVQIGLIAIAGYFIYQAYTIGIKPILGGLFPFLCDSWVKDQVKHRLAAQHNVGHTTSSKTPPKQPVVQANANNNTKVEKQPTAPFKANAVAAHKKKPLPKKT